MNDLRSQLALAVKQVPLLERDQWKSIAFRFQVDVLTRKAVMIGGQWIPLSQVRCDYDSKMIYVARWFYQKELRGKLRTK